MGKLGVVLSGGVAKGAYECGVIRAMAQRGLQPDVIVGISAGAMNGAMMGGMIMGGDFTVENIDQKMIATWLDRVNLSQFYHSFDGDDAMQDLDRKSLNNLFLRFGIDPFEKVWMPTKIDPKALSTLENILRGNFVSMFSHAHFRQLAHEWTFPETIGRSVKFSAAICNLMGSTSLNPDDETIERAWAHFEDFHWYPNMPRTQNFIQFSRLLDIVMASSSFPLAFSPMRLTLPGATKSGLFIDGGMTDNAPIGKAIKMDPEVDTVLVVMSTTIVPPPDGEPDDILKIFSRMCEMLAGKFIINNYHQVIKANRRIAALQRIMERDADGEMKDSAFNEDLAVAAGFKGMADFRTRRVVKLIPIIPSTPLKGDLFAGFRDKKLLKSYIDLGFTDALAIFDQRLNGQDAPESAAPIPG